ncbi:class I SAM-dependent methyltransferase [Cytobacillus firmus]|uniref:class I SAM-dependent methyltransferase n=1 Tax=Cytobacillus firmus TaxID=1399 RepID=UPI0036C5BFD4
MNNNNDRITEAFNGKLGVNMQRKTKKRVDWIIGNTKGNNILDVGCSQGIISIILGKKGKNVIGIDISEKAINFAKSLILNEEKKITNVEFFTSDFIREFSSSDKFDTIIITEVLEHYNNSSPFLSKAYKFLKPKGQILITVPFGINEHPGHIRTLYFAEIYKEMYPLFQQIETFIVEDWIAFKGVRRKEIINKTDDIQVPIKLFEEVETAFVRKERTLLNQIKQNN